MERTKTRIKAIPFVPARYIRTFIVIFGVNCVLKKTRILRYVGNIALYPHFVFRDRRFSLLCDFFLICFYRSPFDFLLESRSFASIQASLGFLALCDLPETFEKKIPEILFFFRGFWLRKTVFPVF